MILKKDLQKNYTNEVEKLEEALPTFIRKMTLKF